MPSKNAQLASLKRKAGKQAGKHARAEKAARAALANPAHCKFQRPIWKKKKNSQ